MSDNFGFGQKVTVNAVLYRRAKKSTSNHRDVFQDKHWERDVDSFYNGKSKRKEYPKQGIVIGKRTLANGSSCGDNEYGAYFAADEYIAAYLVAFDMKTTPKYVLPSDIKAYIAVE